MLVSTLFASEANRPLAVRPRARPAKSLARLPAMAPPPGRHTLCLPRAEEAYFGHSLVFAHDPHMILTWSSHDPHTILCYLRHDPYSVIAWI